MASLEPPTAFLSARASIDDLISALRRCVDGARPQQLQTYHRDRLEEVLKKLKARLKARDREASTSGQAADDSLDA